MFVFKLHDYDNVTQDGDRVSKDNKSYHICSIRLKMSLAKYETYGTLSMYNATKIAIS